MDYLSGWIGYAIVYFVITFVWILFMTAFRGEFVEIRAKLFDISRQLDDITNHLGI